MSTRLCPPRPFALACGAGILVALAACADKYVPLDPDLHGELKFSRKVGVVDGKRQPSTYTIERVTINGYPIALNKSPETKAGSVLLETKEYGPIKVRIKESEHDFAMTLGMTREQQERLRKLPAIVTDPGATLRVANAQLRVGAAELGDAFTLDGGRAVPDGLLQTQQVLGVRIGVLSGEATAVARGLEMWVTDEHGTVRKPLYARADGETKVLTVLYGVPKAETAFLLHLDHVVVDVTPHLGLRP